ncbi:TonB-dependent receptor [Pseudoduganella namucuonensis]|uniref:TonB-dependent receptor n=1 Tax=Pseudoduganella namucuonensis TaxID=1035707 RepID=A0A1I7IMH3_9BURK|nr:TonB-dependent receptor [Pseudoduganella namucuonensis]SFU74130.1 TonB-dependent receptor [Pseudoduganella namucuonensis]
MTRHHSNFRHPTFQAKPIALAVLMLAAMQAQAQEAKDAAADSVVVVTGFRASLNSALNTKKNSDGILDVIKAEDIAKFPDANLAESLQRVPGVSLTRGDGGEGKQITVRGLNAGFTRVRINGIEGVTATGASDINGSTNRGRGFDFSVFASELFNSLEVRKTSEAAVEEGSLGATVDLRTARPFDFKGETFSLGGQGSWNSLSRKAEPRVTALYSNRWDSGIGKLGALVSIAHSRRTIQEEGYEAVELLSASADGGFCSPAGYAPQNPGNSAVKGIDAANCGFGVPRTSSAAAYADVMGRTDNYGGTVASPAAGSGAFAPRIPRYRRSLTNYERTGVTGSLQWRPGSATELNLDLLGGKFDNKRYDNYISAISFGRSLAQSNGKPQSSIVDAHFDGNGSWDYGKFNAVDIRTEGLLDKYSTLFKQHVISGRHDFSDRFKVDFLSGVSNSDLDEPMRATVQFDTPNVNGFSYDFRQNRNVPTLNFGMDVSNPNLFTFAPQEADGTFHGQFVGRYLHTKNKLKTNAVNASFELNDNLTLRGGLSKRGNTWTNVEIGSGGNGLRLPAGVTMDSISRQIGGFGRGLGGSGVATSWSAVDLDKFLKVYDIECHCAAVPGSEYNLLNQANRGVEESINALYASADFKYDVGPIPIRGNVGVRGAETEATSFALLNANGALTPATISHKYRDWLPALNVTAQLPQDVLLRFSAGKTLSRPEYTDLAPSTTLSSQSQTVSIGNPTLDPIRARTYDLQAEWYYAKNAMISAGFFRKEINTFIQGVSERAVFSSLGLPDSILLGGGCSITGGTPACATLPGTTVVVNRKVNTPGGPLNGYELNLQAPFSFLPGAWSNFGALANYTYVKSKISYITRVDNPNTAANELLSQTANFTGLSPRAYNMTLYYEDPKFSARVSAAHRSAYLLNVLGDVAGHDYTVVDGSTNVDFSVSYNLTPKLRLSFEGQNLTDVPLRYGRDSQRNDTLLYVHSGRSFVVGLSYKY